MTPAQTLPNSGGEQVRGSEILSLGTPVEAEPQTSGVYVEELVGRLNVTDETDDMSESAGMAWLAATRVVCHVKA